MQRDELVKRLAEQYDGDTERADLAVAKALGEKQEIERLERLIAERGVVRPAIGSEHGSPSATLCYDAPTITKWLSPAQVQRTPRDAEERAIQRVWDECQIAAKLSAARWNDPLRGARCYLEQIGQTKAIDSYTSTGASEWVASVTSADFLTTVQARAKLAGLIPQFTMGAKVVTLPGSSGRATFAPKIGRAHV